MRVTRIVILSLAAMLAACGSSRPSAELVDARRTYDRARTGPAAALAPADLVEARRALDRAERADNGSSDERTLAYVAMRMAEVAMAHAEIAQAKRDHAAAEAAYTQQLEHAADARGEELQQARQRLEVQTGRLRQAEQQAVTSQSQLAAEREARAKAEAETQAALQSLERIAEIRQEQREVVITLNGAVLFEFNKAVLLPIARTRLEEVAKALMEMDPGSTMIVEGHTDARGSDGANLALSQARAEAVVAFLISRGVDPTLIRAVGRGEQEPVADNRTAEGRANNRRVEIRVTRPTREATAP
jgi:outer membrane protein OmpA-like peptidoglycan-associated protein